MKLTVRTKATVSPQLSERLRQAINEAAHATWQETWGVVLDTMGSPVWQWPRETVRGRSYDRQGRRTAGRIVGSPRNIVDTGLLRQSGYLTTTGTLASFRFTLNYATAVHNGAWIYPWGDKTRDRVFLPGRPFLGAILGTTPYPGVEPYPIAERFRLNLRTAYRSVSGR